jgi:hypothetical protein
MNRLSKRLRAVIGEGDRLAHSSSNTKLYAEDYEEVQRRCVGGRTESSELRELVHRGLQRERYRKAASDPAVRELLRTFQEMLDRSLGDVERRLNEQIQTESALALNYLAGMYAHVTFAGEALSMLAGDLAPEEVRRQMWEHYGVIYDRHHEEASQLTAQQVERRNATSRKLRREREETSPPPAPDAAHQNQIEG